MRASTISNYRSYLDQHPSTITQGSVLGSCTASEAGLETLESRPKKARISRKSDKTTIKTASWLDSWTWDSVNWSCAYDSYFTVLRFIWSSNRDMWTRTLSSYSEHMATLVNGFHRLESSDSEGLFDVRQTVRKRLWGSDHHAFPIGRRGADIYSLIQVMSGVTSCIHPTLACNSCGTSVTCDIPSPFGKYTIVCQDTDTHCSMDEYVKDLTSSTCVCGHCDFSIPLRNEYHPMVCFQLPFRDPESALARLRLSRLIEAGDHAYSLKGVIYWSEEAHHFSSRLIDDLGRVYCYDSRISKGTVRYESLMDASTPRESNWLSVMEDRVAALAIYTHSARSATATTPPPMIRRPYPNPQGH